MTRTIMVYIHDANIVRNESNLSDSTRVSVFSDGVGSASGDGALGNWNK